MRKGFTVVASPNFKKPASPRAITCVVIHSTATTGIDSPKRWLCDPESKASAHYLIGQDGHVLQLVDEKNIAWHAGESEWRGKHAVNAFSVGIELVNANDGKDKYPAAQFEACASLTALICKEYGVALEDVVGHKDVAPGRKTDPAGFPWDDFKIRLFELGVKSSKEAA
jgi:N-acetylmuramoyl-L-alanine amidase